MMRKTCPDHTLYRAANDCAPCRDQAAKYERWRQLGRLRGESLRVPGIGTERRLQALAVMGWGSHPIAARLGVDPVLVERWRRGKAEVHRDTARRVDAVFRELCMTPGPSKVAADRARAKGWASPLAWDDIDHDAHPNLDGSEGGPPRADVDAVVRLTRAGRSATEIAVALGVSRRTVVRVRARVKETAA